MIILQEASLKFKATLDGDPLRDGETNSTTFERPDVHGMDLSPEDEKKFLSVLDDLEAKPKGTKLSFVGTKSKNRYEITRL